MRMEQHGDDGVVIPRLARESEEEFADGRTDGRTDGAEGKDEFRTTTVGLLEMWNPQERDKTSTQI